MNDFDDRILILADDIRDRRLAQARRTSPEDKLLDGFRLYDQACQWMLAGLKHQHPEADDAVLKTLLVERLNRLRQRDESGLYSSLGTINDQ